MTDDVTSAEHARRRADEAAARAEELRERIIAMRAGKEPPHGSSPEELDAGGGRAEQAVERLRHALEASADAHDRAADAYDEQLHRFGDPDGTLATRAADHRRAGARDRERAGQTDLLT
jgi:hypothetical protein